MPQFYYTPEQSNRNHKFFSGITCFLSVTSFALTIASAATKNGALLTFGDTIAGYFGFLQSCVLNGLTNLECQSYFSIDCAETAFGLGDVRYDSRKTCEESKAAAVFMIISCFLTFFAMLFTLLDHFAKRSWKGMALGFSVSSFATLLTSLLLMLDVYTFYNQQLKRVQSLTNNLADIPVIGSLSLKLDLSYSSAMAIIAMSIMGILSVLFAWTVWRMNRAAKKFMANSTPEPVAQPGYYNQNAQVPMPMPPMQEQMYQQPQQPVMNMNAGYPGGVSATPAPIAKV